MNEENHPKVFISYSHDSDEHKEWVLNLATHLRKHGVDAILDQWDLKIGEDLRFFMEQGISRAKLILCVCSENYVNKSNNGTGGTGYESMILTQELLKNVNTNYIIPIVRNNRAIQKTPICLESKLYIDFENDELFFDKYRELLERIYNQDKKPKLGENPFKSDVAMKIDTKKNIARIQYSNASIEGKAEFNYSNNNGNFNIGVAEYEFTTRWSCCSNDAIYAYGDIGYINRKDDFPKFEEIVNFDFTSRVRTVYKDEIIIFRNIYNKFVAIKILQVDSKSHGRENDKLVFEYKIYKEI